MFPLHWILELDDLIYFLAMLQMFVVLVAVVFLMKKQPKIMKVLFILLSILVNILSMYSSYMISYYPQTMVYVLCSFILSIILSIMAIHLLDLIKDTERGKVCD